ncbi:hypothetical protein SLOPH_1688 [Spraguea lophii 42_110]|uniref:Uncharacterized protein n=1 Tax=Spraguea lophii (strain 42_110) TaxID=1358809 RepID=S7W6S9_SPRLO|nr:hypothetical protein SLOPH_1688 [Spraguea lophii 42_110]
MQPSFSQQFTTELERKFKLTKLKSQLKKNIEDLSITEKALYAALKEVVAPPLTTLHIKAPFVFGTASKRMSVTNFGKISVDPFYHTENVIYPIGYTAKRKYKKIGINNDNRMDTTDIHNDDVNHNNVSNKDRVFYICKIVEKPDLFDIKSSENDRWVGIDAWERFKKDLNITEFHSIEEFYGLDNISVQSKIEASYDVSKLKKYKPVMKRFDNCNLIRE